MHTMKMTVMAMMLTASVAVTTAICNGPALAGGKPNGLSPNGFMLNGLMPNGQTTQGVKFQGTETQGVKFQGTETQGANRVRESKSAATAFDLKAVTIEAVRLPEAR